MYLSTDFKHLSQAMHRINLFTFHARQKITFSHKPWDFTGYRSLVFFFYGDILPWCFQFFPCCRHLSHLYSTLYCLCPVVAMDHVPFLLSTGKGAISLSRTINPPHTHTCPVHTQHTYDLFTPP